MKLFPITLFIALQLSTMNAMQQPLALAQEENSIVHDFLYNPARFKTLWGTPEKKRNKLSQITQYEEIKMKNMMILSLMALCALQPIFAMESNRPTAPAQEQLTSQGRELSLWIQPEIVIASPAPRANPNETDRPQYTADVSRDFDSEWDGNAPVNAAHQQETINQVSPNLAGMNIVKLLDIRRPQTHTVRTTAALQRARAIAEELGYVHLRKQDNWYTTLEYQMESRDRVIHQRLIARLQAQEAQQSIPQPPQSTRQYMHKEIKDDEQCGICLEELSRNAVCIDPCDHHFHSACIVRWQQEAQTNSKNCPNCREKITTLINLEEQK